MASERSQPFRQVECRPGLRGVRKPRLLRYAETEAEKDHPLGGLGGPFVRCRGKPAESDGFECGQRDERSGSANKVATIELCVHRWLLAAGWRSAGPCSAASDLGTLPDTIIPTARFLQEEPNCDLYKITDEHRLFSSNIFCLQSVASVL